MSVAQRRDHLSQQFVELLTVRSATCGSAKRVALRRPINTVKCRIVVTLLNCFPGVVEHSQSTCGCGSGNERGVVGETEQLGIEQARRRGLGRSSAGLCES